MTKYYEEAYTNDGDFDDQRYCRVVSYREGVDRVLEYIESIHAYPKLMSELKWAIEEGII